MKKATSEQVFEKLQSQLKKNRNGAIKFELSDFSNHNAFKNILLIIVNFLNFGHLFVALDALKALTKITNVKI